MNKFNLFKKRTMLVYTMSPCGKFTLKFYNSCGEAAAGSERTFWVQSYKNFSRLNSPKA